MNEPDLSLPPLHDDAVIIQSDASDWRSSVRAAGTALVTSGATLPEYTDRMIAVIDEFGPYIVVAPGLALAHARPGTDVLRKALSVVTLARPVTFGHPHHDPVSVVFALAVANPEEHVAVLARLANVFNDESAIRGVAVAQSAAEIRALLA